MRQLALELAERPAPTFDNFVTGDNAEAVGSLRALIADPAAERFIYLWGGDGVGCSHLLAAVANAAGGRAVQLGALAGGTALPEAAIAVLDEVDSLSDDAQIRVFAAYNALRESGGALVAAGRLPPARLGLRPELASRLAWGLVFEVRPLNDAQRRTALESYARSLGFALAPEVADYLLLRVSRDMRSLRVCLDALDRYSLERKRAVTVPLLRALLQNMNNGGGQPLLP
jgi:DnaA family protein